MEIYCYVEHVARNRLVYPIVNRANFFSEISYSWICCCNIWLLIFVGVRCSLHLVVNISSVNPNVF